jgi:thiol:disulfide interchange protein DsbD
MEQSVLSDDRVRAIIDSRYILVTLMVDDKTSLPAPLHVTENGRAVTLRTVGDKWSYLQRSRFGANAQPFYVLMDADEQLLASPRSYDEDIPAFLDWLRSGLK